MKNRYVIAMITLLALGGTAVAAESPATTFRKLAEAYANRGSDKGAQHFYGKALAADPNDVATYQSRGFYYLKTHQSDKALEDFSKQIAVKPDDPFGYMNRGILLGSLGRSGEAQADFRKACDLGYDDGCTMLEDAAKESAK